MSLEHDAVKSTPEWIALNNIWKSCSQEQRTKIKTDFEVLANYIRANHTPKVAPAKSDWHEREKTGQDEYAYLNHVSPEAKQFVKDMIQQGEKNIYHSIMAVLQTKPQLNLADFTDYYFDKNRAKRPYLIENKALVSELIAYCWRKFHNSAKVGG